LEDSPELQHGPQHHSQLPGQALSGVVGYAEQRQRLQATKVCSLSIAFLLHSGSPYLTLLCRLAADLASGS